MTDSIKEAIDMCLQDLSRAVKDRTLWTLFLGSPGVGVNSLALNTQTVRGISVVQWVQMGVTPREGRTWQ